MTLDFLCLGEGTGPRRRTSVSPHPVAGLGNWGGPKAHAGVLGTPLLHQALQDNFRSWTSTTSALTRFSHVSWHIWGERHP